jgi:hypothetical protein
MILYTQIANLWSHPCRFGATDHSTAPTLRLLRPIQVIRECGLSAADLCAVHASAGDAPEQKSLIEAAGQSGCAGVKLRQQVALWRNLGDVGS